MPGHTRPEMFSRKQWLKRAGSRHYKIRTRDMRSRLRKQLSTFLKGITSTSTAEGGVSEASRDSEEFYFRNDLQQCRDAYPVSQAHGDCAKVNDSYSCGILLSGGLDTLAAIRCGFTPKWGTETFETKQRLWSSMPKTVSLGDTFKTDFTDPSNHVVYLKSGQTMSWHCVDYSSSHEGRNPPGSTEEAGWMFVLQVGNIMVMMP